MKKLLFVILIPLLSTSIVFGQMGQENQEEDELFIPESTIGVRGGYNFSKIDSDLGANTVRRKGIHVGVFYEKFLSPKFSIQPEIQYTSEGWIREDPNGDIEAKLSEMSLTTVGKFHIVRGVNLQAGIQAALIMEASDDAPGVTYSLDERLQRFNPAAIFGIGYDFGFGLRLGGRYVQGLININDGYNPGASTVNNEIKTTTFQVYVGYGLALPGKDRGRAGE